MSGLPPRLASAFARVALANVEREYPHKLDHLLDELPASLAPRRLHPAFFGSFDWHSAVHMHWLLARLLRTHPALPEADAMRHCLDVHLSPGNVAQELAYFTGPSGRSFERPYGWAWLLALQAELLRLAAPRLSDALAPLAKLLATRFAGFVAAAHYPIRAGSHGNTAFACLLALDYARVAGDAALVASIDGAARRWYSGDRDAPLAYEPSLDDFLSPALVEASLMRQLMAPEEFGAWFANFMPEGLGPLAQPPTVADRSDPKQAHLDGLALSRAWCFARLGSGFGEAAERHLAAAQPQVAGGDYMGEHWLASFAALALGDAP